MALSNALELTSCYRMLFWWGELISFFIGRVEHAHHISDISCTLTPSFSLRYTPLPLHDLHKMRTQG